MTPENQIPTNKPNKRYQTSSEKITKHFLKKLKDLNKWRGMFMN